MDSDYEDSISEEELAKSIHLFWTKITNSFRTANSMEQAYIHAHDIFNRKHPGHYCKLNPAPPPKPPKPLTPEEKRRSKMFQDIYESVISEQLIKTNELLKKIEDKLNGD